MRQSVELSILTYPSQSAQLPYPAQASETSSEAVKPLHNQVSKSPSLSVVVLQAKNSLKLSILYNPVKSSHPSLSRTSQLLESSPHPSSPTNPPAIKAFLNRFTITYYKEVIYIKRLWLESKNPNGSRDTKRLAVGGFLLSKILTNVALEFYTHFC